MTEQEAIKALKEHKEMIDKEYIKARNSKAIEVVLNALKEKDKTIEKLREDNTIFALEGSRIALKLYIENNYTSIQKIKDKIEKYKNMLKTCNKAQDIDRIKAINQRVLGLQELLEEEK